MTSDNLTTSFQILSYFYAGDSNFSHQVGVLRIHPEGGDWSLGSPYSWAATLVIDGNEATIYGATKSVKPSEWRELRRFFKWMAVVSVHWDRKKTKVRQVTKEV